MALPADPISISVARVGLRRWLAGWLWPADQVDDIVLAVSEAASNAIEHAYVNQPPGTVDIRGRIEATPCGQRRVTIIVRDRGRWRPPPSDHENRRRGIPIMRACMDSVTIEQPHNDPVGTRVMLCSKAVPPREEHC
ncbi:MAG TPA: ATP-binding protein [Pseudonocardiaceae bacterium]|nr:ATP-binding protein [Pseudonocardiaceae bacterium]